MSAIRHVVIRCSFLFHLEKGRRPMNIWKYDIQRTCQWRNSKLLIIFVQLLNDSEEQFRQNNNQSFASGKILKQSMRHGCINCVLEDTPFLTRSPKVASFMNLPAGILTNLPLWDRPLSYYSSRWVSKWCNFFYSKRCECCINPPCTRATSFPLWDDVTRRPCLHFAFLLSDFQRLCSVSSL